MWRAEFLKAGILRPFQSTGKEFKKMGKATEPMLSEFREEAATTKRVLERVPAQKLAWKPHAKSMTLGQLAWHIAKVPGDLARITQPDSI